MQSTVWSEIHRARSGESVAFRHFVNRYRPVVIDFLRLKGLSHADQEDLAQEVFLNIVRDDVLAGTDPRKGRFRSLILAITKRVLANDLRSRNALKRGGGRRGLSMDEAPYCAPAGDDPIFDRVWSKHFMTLALSELEAAHPNQDRAIRLQLHGLSQSEIAEKMECSVAAVNNHIHRGKEFIRKRMRALVAESCRDEQDYQRELRHLGAYLG